MRAAHAPPNRAPRRGPRSSWRTPPLPQPHGVQQQAATDPGMSAPRYDNKRCAEAVNKAAMCQRCRSCAQWRRRGTVPAQWDRDWQTNRRCTCRLPLKHAVAKYEAMHWWVRCVCGGGGRGRSGATSRAHGTARRRQPAAGGGGRQAAMQPSALSRSRGRRARGPAAGRSTHTPGAAGRAATQCGRQHRTRSRCTRQGRGGQGGGGGLVGC